MLTISDHKYRPPKTSVTAQIDSVGSPSLRLPFPALTLAFCRNTREYKNQSSPSGKSFPLLRLTRFTLIISTFRTSALLWRNHRRSSICLILAIFGSSASYCTLLLVYCSCHDRTAVVAAAILRPQLAIAESQKLLIAPAQQRSTFLPRSMPPPPLLLFPPAYDAAERSWPVPALP